MHKLSLKRRRRKYKGVVKGKRLTRKEEKDEMKK
jgi:hypothetical protein